MNKKIFLIFVLLSIFLNGLLWLSLVPLWHFPDEQSHFGQVSYMAETGKVPDGTAADLTEEIYISEKLLGTERDRLGNNKFTFHPEYKIEYTDSFIGKYEKEISNLSQTSAKNNFVKVESTHYSKLYYQPAALLYKLFYNQDLFIRVFIVRLYSLLLFVTNVYISYKIATLIFLNNRLYPIVIASLVGFQPMMVFSNVGVNSDSLGNLIFSLFIYQCLKLIKAGVTKVNLTILFAISLLSIYIKPQFIITYLIVWLLLFFLLIRDFTQIRHKNNLRTIIISILIVSILIYLFAQNYFSLINLIFAQIQIDISSLFKFTREYTFSHTISEVLPWYWGVYKWLGVTYPRLVHRIINRLLILIFFGIVIFIYNVFKNKALHEKKIQSILFLMVINVVFFASISVYDWFSWYTSKYQLGVQGRYFFPLISSHMILILVGWESLFSLFKKLEYWMAVVLEILMIILNFIALSIVSSVYYDISSLAVLLKEISQYKPLIFKAPTIIILLAGYIFFLLKLFYLQYLFVKQNN